MCASGSTAGADFTGRSIRLLIAALGLSAAVAAALPAHTGPALTALTWIAPGQERQVLLEQPATCLNPAISSDQVRIGQALFNAPDLFGGQAARAAISCASCHINGRRNPAFFLGGISREPGTADVSSSFFSMARADGRFDPKPIPDLAQPGKVNRDPGSGALERFIRGLVVEEFAGREPSTQQLAALASYVRAVRTCPGRATEPRNLASDLLLVRASIDGAIGLLDQQDLAGAAVLIKAARFRLGLIDERMTGAKLNALHKPLLRAALDLAQLPLRKADLAQWQAEFDRHVTPRLTRNEHLSLYAPGELDLWLAVGRRAK